MNNQRFVLDTRKVKLAMARKQLNISGLADVYGVSRARMNTILNQKYISYVVLGRMAAALGVEPEEIIE